MEYDYVFHFAAESHVDRSINGAMGFISNNVVGITSLLDYIKEFSPKARVINVSTDEVYGHLSKYDDPFSETSHINPRSPYSASKASADLIANAYCQTYGLDIITTRCCNNYGPHQHNEKFIPTILRSLKEGKKIPVYGNGENIREWIYVEDHNKSILEIANIGKSGKVYHIKSGVERSNIELINDILKFGGFYDKLEDVIEFVGDRKGHDFRYALDSFRYKRIFDLISYEKALKETIGHYWD
jgi:dTDP-glucose 4,6-dehydratase